MSSRTLFFVFGACALIVGCGSDAVGVDGSCSDLVAGDLVITEILANPEGADEGQEYVELFNASRGPVELQGVTLRTSPIDDPSNARSETLGELGVAPGEYAVIGLLSLEEGMSPPAHVDLAIDAGSLRNSESRIEIVCDDTVVDAVTYSGTASGRGAQLDGAIAPDAVQNDGEGNWCDATTSDTEFTPGNFGTPGAANSACEIGPTPKTCNDIGVARELVRPQAGDVHITEWMPNPEGADGDLEWFELRINNPFDLNALQIGTAEMLRETVGGTDCIAVGAGSYIVIGRSPDAAPAIDATFGFNLGNSDEQTIVVGIDDIVIDTVRYTGAIEGRSWQVDSTDALCLAEDDMANEYAAGNFGTPGAANPSCPPMVMPGQCLDNGTARAIAKPTVGQLEISEWLADPAGTGTDSLEWIEIRATASLDLNEIVLSDSVNSTDPLESVDCISVTAGDHVVFVRNASDAPESGINDFIGAFGFGLNNGGDDISVSIDGMTIDMLTFASSADGVATQVEAGGGICEVDTDVPANEYNPPDGNFGTPGAANPDCQ